MPYYANRIMPFGDQVNDSIEYMHSDLNGYIDIYLVLVSQLY